MLVRERIDVVHGHQAFSSLAHQAVLHAGGRRVPSVFTDHSLFGFSDASSILTNKVLQFTLSAACRVVCVSHTSKENTVLRSEVAPGRVSVIPNAVDGPKFAPEPAARSYTDGRVVVVCMGRLEYRKGIDLLADVIPQLCSRRPEVRFLIGGDGPKRSMLEAVVAQHGLQGRVELLGDVPHWRVRSVLTRGHVFLNTSLTESFCMAALEAACCGLLVVATAVGGVPEILPPEILLLAPASPPALTDALDRAVERLPTVDPVAQHREVCGMYHWGDVARRVEIVYGKAIGAGTGDGARARASVNAVLKRNSTTLNGLLFQPLALAENSDSSLSGRVQRLRRCGPFSGPIFCAVAAAADLYQRWLVRALEVVMPAAGALP